MTSPVNNVGLVLDALRKQLAERTVATDRAGRQAGAPDTTATAGTQSAQARVRERILALDPSDPDRRRKAMRVMLHVVLQNEFGETFANSPNFASLLDEVQTAMEADPKLNALFGKLLATATGSETG